MVIYLDYYMFSEFNFTPEAINNQTERIGKARFSEAKAHEAEDLIPSKRIRRRSASLHSRLDKTSNRTKEIKEKSGSMWECVDRKPNKLGGYIYIFQIKPEYNDLTGSDEEKNSGLEAGAEKMHETFPAFEFLGSQLDYLDPKSNLEPSEEEREEYWDEIRSTIPKEKTKEECRENFRKLYRDEAEILQRLGFQRSCKEGAVYLEIPEPEALRANWESVREGREDLPELDIASSEGVASNLEFAMNYVTNTVLVSSQQEFVHDNLLHVIPALKEMISSGKLGAADFHAKRAAFKKIILLYFMRFTIANQEVEENRYGLSKERIDKIKNTLPILETHFGAFVDVYPDEDRLKDTVDGFPSILSPANSNVSWMKFMKKQMTSMGIPPDTNIMDSWGDILNLVKLRKEAAQ